MEFKPVIQAMSEPCVLEGRHWEAFERAILLCEQVCMWVLICYTTLLCANRLELQQIGSSLIRQTQLCLPKSWTTLKGF
jgi:hypothetical protein